MRDAGAPDDAITEPTTVPPTTPTTGAAAPPPLPPPSDATASPSPPASPFGASGSPFGATGTPLGATGTPLGTAAGIASPAPDDGAMHDRHHHGPGSGPIVVGLLLILAGAYLLTRELFPDVRVAQVWPVAVIVVGLLLIALSFIRKPRDRAR